MINRVGKNVPKKQEIQKLLREVEKIESGLSKYTVSLSSDERRRTVKFRTGGEPIVAQVAELSRDKGIEIGKNGVEEMERDLDLARLLIPLATRVRGLLRTLDDTILEAESECWWAAMAHYSALAKLAVGDPALAAALEPIVEFFAIGPREKKSPRAKDGTPE